MDDYLYPQRPLTPRPSSQDGFYTTRRPYKPGPPRGEYYEGLPNQLYPGQEQRYPPPRQPPRGNVPLQRLPQQRRPILPNSHYLGYPTALKPPPQQPPRYETPYESQPRLPVRRPATPPPKVVSSGLKPMTPPPQQVFVPSTTIQPRPRPTLPPAPTYTHEKDEGPFSLDRPGKQNVPTSVFSATTTQYFLHHALKLLKITTCTRTSVNSTKRLLKTGD